MKKFLCMLFVLLSMLLISGNAYCGNIVSNSVALASGTTSLAVASTATVYTRSIDIGDSEYFSVAYWTAAGTANVTIQIEQSWTLPATEGAADSNYAIPVNMPDVVTALTTESTVYIKPINPVAMRYLRFKITGNSGNDAGTIVYMKFGRKHD